MAEITISLVGANGDTIVLGTTPAETSYILGAKVAGFGLTGLSVNIKDGAGDGGKYLSTRRLTRQLDLPIYTIGTNEADVESKLRRLGRLLSDRSGATRLKATYTDGTVWYLDGYLVSGGDVTYGTDAGQQYALWTIQLSCPQPYWTKETATSVVMTDGGIGTVSLTNNGDIETYIKIVIVGKVSNPHFSNSYGSLSIDGTVNTGETYTIDCELATVVDQTGANHYFKLGTLPKMIRIPRGTSTLTITKGSTEAGASVTISWHERRELIF